MRRGEILAYYEHVKVAYSVFLAEFHMWQAASWHVRSGCINHVLLHHIPCAGCWKPLMGHSGGWGSDFVELEAGLGGERGLGNGGNFGKAQDFLPSTDGHHQVESGLGVQPHPMDYSIMLWQPKVQKCSASGGKGFQLRVGKLLTKFSSFCEQSGLYFFRICWLEGDRKQKLGACRNKKSMWGGENPLRILFILSKAFSNRYNIKKENIDAEFFFILVPFLSLDLLIFFSGRNYGSCPLVNRNFHPLWGSVFKDKPISGNILASDAFWESF